MWIWAVRLVVEIKFHVHFFSLIISLIRPHLWPPCYDTRCYFNVRSKANMSQLNLPHGTDN